MLKKIQAFVSTFLSREAAKFLVAGATTSLINWAVRFPLSSLMPLFAAVVCAYVVGMIVGFWLYRQWVFEPSALPLRTEIVRFCGVNVVGLIVASVTTVVLASLAGHAGYGDAPAIVGACHALAIAVAAVANFVGHKFLTFAGN